MTETIEPLIFDLFFEKYESLIARGKGFSIYNTNEQMVENFLAQMKKKKLGFQLVTTAAFTSNALDLEAIAAQKKIMVWHQNQPFEDFRTKGRTIADKFIFPLWFKRVPIFFFSDLESSAYSATQFEPANIHENLDKVVNDLLVEQIFSLLDRSNYKFSDPRFLDLPADKIIYTPIEEMMKHAFEQAEIKYMPQVRFGRYIVDFVVEIDHDRIIVECDGKAYHDVEADTERDKVLSRENLPICRFTGSEIYTNANACVEKIQERILERNRNEILLDDNLDASQNKALEAIDGPIRVLAPAGSGKTKTLVNRIFHLINQGVPREKILALAFNKKAAEEMQNRLVDRGVANIEVRTFHSLGYEIVREVLGWKFDGTGYKKTRRQLMELSVRKHAQLPYTRNQDPLDTFLDQLQRTKMELPKLNKVGVEFGEKLYPFKKIFNTYLEEQINRNYFDFDDMIYIAVRLLLKDRILRKRYQEQFEYILVDEFQDLNRAQLLLLEIISLPQNNLFAVGDDDQMIYGWRGAEIRNILDFSKRYPVSKTIVLETNYRSSKKIVHHSGWLISNNVERVEKHIKPVNSAKPGNLALVCAPSTLNQAVEVVQWIQSHHEEHRTNWKDYAFLYRYNAYQFPIAAALDGAGIPHTPVSGNHLFTTLVGQDIYAYLIVILFPNEATPENYDRILKRPNKYLSNALISRVRDWASLTDLPNHPDLRDWEIDNLVMFIIRIQRMRELANDPQVSAIAFMQALLLEFTLVEFYKDQSSQTKALDEAGDGIKLEVITDLAGQFDNIQNFFQFIHKTLEDDLLELQPKVSQDEKQDEVYLSTIHGAKGNEFTYVVYFNMSDPSRRIEEDEIEEERRVAYVAATRPKEELLVTSTTGKPSQFLRELILNPAYAPLSIEKLRREIEITRANLTGKNQKKEGLQTQRNQLMSKLSDFGTGDGTMGRWLLVDRIRQWLFDWRRSRLLSKIEKLDGEIDMVIDKVILPLESKIEGFENEMAFRSFLKQDNPTEIKHVNVSSK